jgi:UDP-N-acetylglucosamine--N-acetylmuramyl-(pentapeptide) pyrophosphoryl-undecaprenol N-acetylglucosamine transferase
VDYIEHMENAYGIADLVVCRAGATSVAELAVCGRPAVLVPWRGAADDHQMANARLLQEAHACEIADERDLIGGGLATLVEAILDDARRLTTMAEHARRLGARNATVQVLGELTGWIGEAASG